MILTPIVLIYLFVYIFKDIRICASILLSTHGQVYAFTKIYTNTGYFLFFSYVIAAGTFPSFSVVSRHADISLEI